MSATKTGEHNQMKKIVISTLAALSIATVASASSSSTGADTFYKDANGQVFTTEGEGRTPVNMTSLTSKTSKIDLSMLAYLGYVNQDFRNKSDSAGKNVDTNRFEARRMYFQAKAFMDDNKKNYFRLTYDVFDTGSVSQSGTATASNGDYYAAQVKYAYLYLDQILPFTDIEIGQAHTTLLDYEEGHAWDYRCLEKVFTEQGNGPKFHQSAGRGIDLKTNTKYFSSEVGVYNNAGYHDAENTYSNNGMGMDYEGRFTAHVLGTGTDYNTAHTYFDVSLLAKTVKEFKNGAANNTNNANDLTFVGVHSVFNTKPLLVAAQYISSQDTDKTAAKSTYAGSGYSANFDARAGEKDQYHVFGRVDSFTFDQLASTATEKSTKRTYIGGMAWDMNKNVKLLANFETIDNKSNKTTLDSSNNNYANVTNYMLTAQVQF